MINGGGISYDRYRTGNSDEWMMRIGAPRAPAILILPPLFEEMNRTRAFLASIMRIVAEQGYGCWLPDLPGTGESIRPLDGCSWEDWRAAARDAAAHAEQAGGAAPIVVSFRGGALLDDAVAGPAYFRFAPAEGSALARDLIRASLLAREELQGPRVELAGYRMSDTLLAELSIASLARLEPLRTLRLASDPRPADAKVEGAAIWRRSEPANAPELARLVASEILDWCARCGVS